MQTQTTEDKDIQTVLSGPTIAVQTVGGMDPDTAARIITRGFRRLLQYQRMVNFRQLQGYLFCRDYKVNEVSGALEIMSMHMIFNHIDNKCMHLRFTILDYVTCKFTYTGIYDQLDYVRLFSV